MTAEEAPRRAIRITLLVWAAALLVGASVGLRARPADPVAAGILACLAVAGFGLLWHGGLLLFDLLFAAGWLLFGRRTPFAAWREKSRRSLRILPWAGSAGAALWLVHAAGPFRGWPGDAILGSLANVIGAVVYGSILLAWRRVRKA